MTDTSRVDHVLKTGAAIELVLEGNPSTGYDWDALASDVASLALVEIVDLGAAPPAVSSQTRLFVGAPVLRRWRVTALGAGTVQLNFSYRRPWESSDPVRTHTVILDISN